MNEVICIVEYIFQQKARRAFYKETRAVEEIIGGPFMKKNLAEHELEISKKAS
jgi:hypothetical protein